MIRSRPLNKCCGSGRWKYCWVRWDHQKIPEIWSNRAPAQRRAHIAELYHVSFADCCRISEVAWWRSGLHRYLDGRIHATIRVHYFQCNLMAKQVSENMGYHGRWRIGRYVCNVRFLEPSPQVHHQSVIVLLHWPGIGREHGLPR